MLRVLQPPTQLKSLLIVQHGPFGGAMLPNCTGKKERRKRLFSDTCNLHLIEQVSPALSLGFGPAT